MSAPEKPPSINSLKYNSNEILELSSAPVLLLEF